jgi:hypothetical protein
MIMKIEGIANWTAQWYFLLVPSLCCFYDRDQKAVGVAFMWFNFIVGAQVRRDDDKVVIKNNND